MAASQKRCSCDVAAYQLVHWWFLLEPGALAHCVWNDRCGMSHCCTPQVLRVHCWLSCRNVLPVHAGHAYKV